MKHINKIWISMLILAITVALCACGTDAVQYQTTAPDVADAQPSAAVEVEKDLDAGNNASDTGIIEIIGLDDVARRFVGGPIEDLIEELGEPESREYVPSCLGAGEDGELRYARFTVYTFKGADGEIVIDVE